MHMNPKLGCMCPYTPDGRFVHVPPPVPYASWRPIVAKPWWEDDYYCIGKLSQKTRKIRIVNTLTKDEHIIEVNKNKKKKKKKKKRDYIFFFI